MTQAWTKAGKRVPVTCLNVVNNAVVGQKELPGQDMKRIEIGFGKKKLKNMTKPLRTKLEKSGFSFGVRSLREISVPSTTEIKTGDVMKVEQIFQVGDVVNVQGVTKGRGFAGAIKRHGFSGGPKTHGQSDRWRAVGAIGQRTTPGRVFRGKKMPGHYGVETQTVKGLIVLYIDPATQQLWLSGPVPGHITSVVTVAKTGENKAIELDTKASGLKVADVVPVEVVETEAAEVAPEAAPEVSEAPAEGETV